ncbi:MAG: hypothetical protein ABI868_10890 [Acidobacteriota bacterium]
MKRVALTAALAVLVTLPMVSGAAAWAQDRSELQTLRRDIEQRFEVLPRRGSIVLTPRDGSQPVRSIELTARAINIDGAPVTGGELRDQLGSDADLVLKLSYLEPAVRMALFAPAAAVPAEAVTPDEPGQPNPPGEAVPAPSRPARPQRPRRPPRGFGDRENDRVRFGGSVRVEAGETVDGDAVAIGGSVRIDGIVTDNAVAIGGDLVLGPDADVRGDAVVVGGTLRRDPGAQIGGKIVDVGSGNFDFSGWRGWSGLPFGRMFFPFTGAALGLLALMSTLARTALLGVLASLVVLVGREYIERVAARAEAEPVKAGAIGFLAQLLFVPVLALASLVLVVTIIGIPLAIVLIPVAVLGLAVIGLVGFTAVAFYLGGLVKVRFNWIDRNPYLTVITGIVVLISPVLIARLLGLAGGLVFPISGALSFFGFLLEYAAWTVGFGAVALLRFARPGGTSPVVTV